MANYKTPGVYVEEISKFPPSVAQVETAIPAFIGYTEKAEKSSAEDLLMKPMRITSMLEYVTYFGSAKPEGGISVEITTNDKIIVTDPGSNRSPFLMYYSMQLYFANGGGPCYITSVGLYGDEATTVETLVSKNNLSLGLDAIRKVDEPTLLLFPDATSLSNDGDFWAIYKEALTQCQELQDRFTIMDTYSDTEHATGLSDGNGDPYVTIAPDLGLREGINLSKDFLKYGAAYFPFVETILDYVYDDDDVHVTDSNAVSPEDQVQALSDSIDTGDLEDLIIDLIGLRADVNGAADDNAAIALKPSVRAKTLEIIAYLSEVKETLDEALAIGREETDSGVVTASNALDTWITDEIETLIVALNARLDQLNGNVTKTTILNTISDNPVNAIYVDLGVNVSTPSSSTIITTIDTLITSGEMADLITALGLLPSAGNTVISLSDLETLDNIAYNRIKDAIGQVPITLPSSSAMAGIYARVDANRGVWKAPANEGLNYVIKPSQHISNEEQGDLNVHTTGKSINAIRSFTGKGTLVWGARTLAGNDNEWRYISVRRFFNMVEESVGKATEQFVFEGNDANTWVKVRAMIENFLVLQWKAGALAGAKAEQAFYVRVGLGQTMSAQDILEGRMIVEIGMAVVRPAEFIILRFSHKMQEA